jgi:prepilin-type N-terminal cleavage/methylation domain-containing protein
MSRVVNAARRVGQGGMTLIELLVALLLVTVGLMGLAAAIPAGMFAVSDGGLQLTAIGLARQPIEVAKRTAFSSLPSLAASRAAVSGFSGFQREVLVSDFTAPPDCSGAPCNASCPSPGGAPTCRKVEVRVYYSGNLGQITTTLVLIRAS